MLLPVQVRHDLAGDRQCVFVVIREMVGHARDPGMNAAATQRLGIDDLAGSRLDEWRPPEKDSALVAYDNGFVTHGRHVCAARGARAEHRSDLRNSARR